MKESSPAESVVSSRKQQTTPCIKVTMHVRIVRWKKEFVDVVSRDAMTFNLGTSEFILFLWSSNVQCEELITEGNPLCLCSFYWACLEGRLWRQMIEACSGYEERSKILRPGVGSSSSLVQVKVM